MKKAVLIGVPHHNNLGDHAIVLAEREYIEDNFKEYQYYEVSEETAEKCLEKVEKHIHPEDILFLHGGRIFICRRSKKKSSTIIS